MSEPTETHRHVSQHYAKAVKREADPGCCGGQVTQKGVVVKAAGYDAAELAALPDDAVENAFGCGNPLAFAEVEAGETVLDLGSGAGIDLLLAAEKVGSGGHVIGVDMTEEMIARARANIAAAGHTNVEVRKGLIEALPVETGTVDWVISNCVINLSPDKASVFAEIARVLRPGGCMRVSDIVVEELPEWARQSTQLYSSCVAGAISEHDYVAGLEAAGLTDVEVTERLIYDTPMVAGLIHSEVPEVAALIEESGLDLSAIAGQLQGKIWSARFHARKPGA
jgi:SAM-dependent methyltransferase